jgi:membrane associated rhomboid family serine protease
MAAAAAPGKPCPAGCGAWPGLASPGQPAQSCKTMPAADDRIPRSVPALPAWRQPAVMALILAALLPEAVLLLADLGLVGSARWRPLAWQYGGFWAGLLHGWRPNYAVQPATMFLTHAVLHAGPGHMAGNALALAGIAPVVADRFGARGLIAICLAAALGGGLAFGLMSQSPAPMVGASGAIFGLAGAWTWAFGADRARAGRSLLPVAGIAAGLALLNYAMWVALGGLLAWETHLGGFVAGAAAAGLIGAGPSAAAARAG